MVSYETFVQHFHTKSNSKTFNTFLKNAHVLTYNKSIIPLRDYIKNKNISIEDLKIIYDHIIDREQYLYRFYRKSLQIPENIHIEDTPMPSTKLDNNQKINYKNVVRNMFWLEIFKNTKSGFDNILSFLVVLENLYLKEIIDYKILTPSAISYIKKGRIGSVLSSFYFRASIMSPYLVYSLAISVLYKNLHKDEYAKVFTPTLGWCSYFYGFAETHRLERYTGIDVIPIVCKKTKLFAEKLYPNISTEIICSPSEDVNGGTKHKGQYNIVFFSPPYFKLELYQGRMQSTERYKSYDEWLSNYWEKTIKLCHFVLRKDGILCYILSGYGSEDVRKDSNIKGGGENESSVSEYNLIKDMNDITKKYFKFIKMYNMYNKNVNSTKHAKTNEKIIIFKK